MATRATAVLDRLGVSYTVHSYEVAERVGAGYGEAVARAMGMPADRVFKTLIAEVDADIVVAVLPVDSRLATKRLARAVGGRQCRLVSQDHAERLTGYRIGAISPFGQRRSMPFYVDSSAMDRESIAVSGGTRGIQLEISPHDLITLTGAHTTDLVDV